MPYTQGAARVAAAPRRQRAHGGSCRSKASRRICCACRPAARSRRAARYRMPICDEPVPLYDFGDGHVARCFLYDERTDGDQRPLETSRPLARRGSGVTRRTTERRRLVEVRDLNKYFPINAGLFSRHVGDVKAVDGVELRDRRAAKRSGSSASRARARRRSGASICACCRRPSGEIIFDGRDIIDAGRATRCAQLRSEMQIIFQDPYASLNPRMTVGDIIARAAARSTASRTGKAAERAGARAAAAGRPAARITPTAIRTSSPAASASASASRARSRSIRSSSSADEPVSALDVSIQAQVINLLRICSSSSG